MPHECSVLTWMSDIHINFPCSHECPTFTWMYAFTWTSDIHINVWPSHECPLFTWMPAGIHMNGRHSHDFAVSGPEKAMIYLNIYTYKILHLQESPTWRKDVSLWHSLDCSNLWEVLPPSVGGSSIISKIATIKKLISRYRILGFLINIFDQKDLFFLQFIWGINFKVFLVDKTLRLCTN